MKLLVLCITYLALIFPVSPCFGGLGNLVQTEAARTSIAPKGVYTLAMLAIFRDEAPYLKEWIEYHKLVGVEHFYLYNNLSEDNYLDVLDPYIRSGEVELLEWPAESENVQEWDKIQCAAYADALQRCRFKTKWLAVADIDEYFVPKKVDSLPEMLLPYENQNAVGGVFANWIFFGTSGIEKVPENQLMTETLTQTGVAPHVLFKSIVKPAVVSKILVHESHYIPGILHRRLPIEVMQINHYWSRDQWYLDHFKKPRRKKWGTHPNTCDAWANGSNFDTKYSIPILRFVPELRKRMGFE